MAKRRKNRTHLKGPARGEDEEEGPRSFVIKVSWHNNSTDDSLGK
jgi:hypothetical protein